MSVAKNTVKLIDILKKELKVLDDYNEGCESLHKYMVARDWTTLENILNTLRKKADRLNTLDMKREDHISLLKEELQLSPQSSFGLLVSRLDDHNRSEIKQLKQKIKHAVNILQTRINGIGKYTATQTSILKDVLDELIPDQKGRIYNSSGTASRVDNTPLLFNHQF